MRALAALPILVVFMAAPTANAQDNGAAGSATSVSSAKTLSPEESTALAEANRKKADALQRARDLKLQRTTNSICSGC